MGFYICKNSIQLRAGNWWGQKHSWLKPLVPKCPLLGQGQWCSSRTCSFSGVLFSFLQKAWGWKRWEESLSGDRKETFFI